MNAELLSWFYRGREAFDSAAGDQATRAFHAADAQVAGAPDSAERDCSAGCSFCCHHPVGVSAVEAGALATELHVQLAPERLAAIRRRIDERNRCGRSWRQLADAREPCPLLEDHLCLAYRARPIGCRGWSSRSRDACASAFDLRTPPPPPVASGFAACLGVAAALGTDRWELASALARALDTDRDARDDAASYGGCVPVDV